MPAISRRECRLLIGVVVIGLAVRVAYAWYFRGHTLMGDEPEYDYEGRQIAAGHWFFTKAPYGIAHEGLWKAPGYPALVGAVYALVGPSVPTLLMVQAAIGSITIVLTYLLGRRLFGAGVGLAAAALVALLPNVWQYEIDLLPDGLALPMALGVMLLVLERRPTRWSVPAVGLLMGVGLLVRPTQFFLFAMVAVAWCLASGVRRGLAATVVAVAVAGVVVAPWTARNFHVSGAFIPISMQDSAAYGTFNADAAHDPVLPYAWRPSTRRDRDLFDPAHPLSDAELRTALQRRARDYALDHPGSVPAAFLWNGLTRTWDIRRPVWTKVEVSFDGRERLPAQIALWAWWVVLALGLVALVRLRRRPALVWPLLAAALAASVVFTSAALGRYRLPFEPVMMMLALTLLPRLALWRDSESGRRGARS